MSKKRCYCLPVLSLALMAFPLSSHAQEPTPSQPGSNSSSTTTVVQTKKPPQDPYILEDGGLSIEPIYWFSTAQPSMKGGKTATNLENLDFAGNSKRPWGGVLSFPAGRSNSLRLSYFRVQGNGNTFLTTPVTLFSENYSPGDYISASYTIQSAKISWDYLSYTWYRPSTKLRLKTLWEIQYLTISTNIDAPFKAPTTDSSGNTDYNTAHGSRNLIDPTFGLELEEALNKHFRWEVKGSGFGIPHRAVLWDAEASIAIRFGQVELLGGEKALHFKTSPQSESYFANTLSGAYVGLRYYWGRQE